MVKLFVIAAISRLWIPKLTFETVFDKTAPLSILLKVWTWLIGSSAWIGQRNAGIWAKGAGRGPKSTP